MNKSGCVFSATRRRFLAMLAALSAALPWHVHGASRPGLSNREAAFYRKSGSGSRGRRLE